MFSRMLICCCFVFGWYKSPMLSFINWWMRKWFWFLAMICNRLLRFGCVCVFFLYYGRVPSVWHFAQMLFGNVRLSFANKFDWYLSDVELRRKMCWRWNSQKIKDKHHFCFFFSLHFVYNSVCWFMDLI